MGQVTQALARRREKTAARVADVAKVQELVPHRALTAAASAIPLDGTGWKNFKLGDDKWQKEAWHHYDINGDLRFIANWVGNACSRARLYIAKIGPDGKPGDEVTDPKIAVLAETVFGSPAAKAEALRLLGVHLFVPGESFIVAEAVANSDEDRWYVVSTSDIKREGEKTIKVKRPQQFGGDEYELKSGTDLLIRVWTPHPRKYDIADSSVRPGLVPLREIEQLTKYEFAQIDSRLAGNGMVLIPQEIDFPRGDGDPKNAEGLTAVVQRAMATALANREDPSSLVPIFVEVAAEHLDKIKHITFESPLNDKVPEMQERATRKLARCLDVDPEILMGKGESNHWTAWQIEESTIRLFVGNPLARMCDALTTGYLRAALGVVDEKPLEYCFWYDVSALTVTPDRQQDALDLQERGLISDTATRKAGSWGEDDAPKEEERIRRLAWESVKLDPSLIRDKAIQEALGVQWELAAAPAPGADTEDGAAPADKPGGGTPTRTGAQDQEKPQRAVADKAAESTQATALLVGTHMAVQRTLELAGKRLLTRENRGKYEHVAAFDLHTEIQVLDRGHAADLVDAAMGDLGLISFHSGVSADLLSNLVGTYCTELIAGGIRHDADLLSRYLQAGLHAECKTQTFCNHPNIPGDCSDDKRQEFHLPGRHDQKTHGHRQGRARGSHLPGIGPLTDAEKRTRRVARGIGVDPDRRASAPDRQGRRAFAEWELHAQGLSKDDQRAQIELEKVERAKRDEATRKAQEERARIEKRRLDAKDKAVALKEAWMLLSREITNKGGEQEAEAISKEFEKNGWVWPDAATEDKIRARIRKRTEKARAEAKEKFFSEHGNVEVISGDSYSPMSQQLWTDTGFDGANAVAIEEYVVAKSTTGDKAVMEKGWAFRQDGVTYAIEIDPESPAGQDDTIGRAVAALTAQRMHEMANKILPPGWNDHTKGIIWSRKVSPGDAYWQQRFNDPNHRAIASAGTDDITFWQRNGGFGADRAVLPGEYDESTLRHEWGHTTDWVPDGYGARISNTKEWLDAAEKDQKAHERAASQPVRRFRQSGYNGHQITTERGPSTKEIPQGVSTYGQSSNQEDFAESVEQYMTGKVGTGILKGDGFVKPIYFRDLFPARARILDKMFPKVAKAQKAEIKAEREF